MGNVAKCSLHRVCVSEKHTDRFNPALTFTFECRENNCSIGVCVVHSNTGDQWHLAWCPTAERWPSVGRGGGGEAKWTGRCGGNDSVLIYPSTHMGPVITYHVRAAMASRRWAVCHTSIVGRSSCLNWHYLIYPPLHTHTHNHGDGEKGSRDIMAIDYGGQVIPAEGDSCRKWLGGVWENVIPPLNQPLQCAE